MKCIIIAGGYATRLFPLTKNFPKPLLEIGGMPLLNRIINQVNDVDKIDEIFIVTNKRFHSHFEQWKQEHSSITTRNIVLEHDGSDCNEDSLGPMGNVHAIVNSYDIKDDILVLAGDNLCELDLNEFLRKNEEHQSSVIALKDLKDPMKLANRFGAAMVDELGFIQKFEEKANNPSSALAATCMYFFKNSDINMYPLLAHDKGMTDAGEFIEFLVSGGRKVHGLVFDGRWHDIGTHDELNYVNGLYSKE